MNPTQKQALIPSVALLLTLVVYAGIAWPALTGPFVFDDFPNLQNLELLGNDVPANLGHYLASFIGNPGRPIAALSFLINDSAWPSDPFGFKYTNLMIHLLNGVLLFGLLRQLAKTNPALPQSAFWPLLAMAAWLFHPLQLSAQMLVVQRMTLLSATFCLIGLWGYIALLQRAKSTLDAFTALSVLGFCTVLALLSKENGALLPLFAWVMNVTLLHQCLESKTRSMQQLLQIGCIAPAILVLSMILYMGIQSEGFANREFDSLDRLMTQMHVLADYLRHILMPRLSGSGIYFDDYPITRSWTNPISTLLLAICFLASLMLAIAKRHRNPILSFGILWFFVGHAMESTILNLELFFEHRNYLPLLGPVLVISVWAFQFKIRQSLGVILLLLWSALLATITALQSPVWGNAELMATLWAKERPHSLRATQELAKHYYDTGNKQKALDGMLEAYDRGIRQPDLPMAALLIKCWNPETRVDRDLYKESLESIPSSNHSNSVLVSLLLLRQAAQSTTCPKLIDEDRWDRLSQELLKNPKFFMVSEANIRIERAKLFIHKRNLDQTMNELEKAYKVAPSVELTQKIAEVLLSAGLTDDAKNWLEEGLSLRKPTLKEWLYDEKKKSRDLLEMIRKFEDKKHNPDQMKE